MLSWASQFNIFSFLDNQQYADESHQYECLLATGQKDYIASVDLKKLDHFLADNSEWIFGHLSYDLKNVWQHFSPKTNKVGFAPLYFFIPAQVVLLTGNSIRIYAEHPEEVYNAIINTPFLISRQLTTYEFSQSLSREEYIAKVRQLREHIVKGDCYEINFCQEFYADNCLLDPVNVYQQLVDLSPNPFSALYRLNDKYLLCASPERFLQKTGNKLISQPIKGTIKRDLLNASADETLKEALKDSQKEQSENVMVVDLVRNDLSKICKEDSVKVEELFGVYTFPQVHHLVSTVSGELQDNTSFSGILEACFPMGSMTGAPKHRVMQLIDHYEAQSRGIFSGCVGYFKPNGDFDFNVVIRSIMYNATEKYLSYQVGSGITFYSDPEKEWEECLLKAEAIKAVLSSSAVPY
jgi:para-aminobenzoate synthetase component 1